MGMGLTLRVVAELARASVPIAAEAAGHRLRRDRVDARARRFGARTLEVLDVQLSVERQAELSPGRGYVYMFNHQSHLDIPVLYATLPSPTIRFVAKAELFRIPLWGAAMRQAEFIEVDRGDHAQAMAAMARAAALVGDGVSIAIAPEGSRSRDGRIGPLKKGGFHLAQGTGAPIVPVAIRGTIDILPRGARAMRGGVPVRVVIGAPIAAAGRPIEEPMAEVAAFLERYVEGN
ncbi:MAG: 1-acyl-sn-glycerol-3-phosphate acyltransferase [Kofleriaceae bacterium]|nr:1-acyl-sn-glycerol-3-phosphate acyltransferase [Myxococcales bacterium]MCB9560426.1 1-acyl-sn-glycerol-3-phosphate acyltransferase [Kofleriaceae bacterium]MCB9571644.1 1-acyl-sn-glycerol-3-phosphate acyltransferase [Kofleriaceae bacterium]